MRTLPFCRGALMCCSVILLFTLSFCYGSDQTVEVVGLGECADCEQSNIQTSHAFSGLPVTVDCKQANGHFRTRGVGKLDEEGKFEVSLPQEIVKDGQLNEECYAQLHSASAAPCPAHNGLESSKVIFKSKANGKHTFGLAGKLKFSPVTCTSAFLWPHYKHPPLPKLPPFPPHPHWKKYFGHHFPYPHKVFPPLPPKVFPPIYKKPLPPIPKFKKPLPPPVPVYKKPLPPPVPKFKKPLPPPIPVYKKPLPPPFPKFKKPLPPPIPVFKPKPPIFKPPSIPKIYHPPLPKFKKPLPPIPIYKPKPPVYHKPLPPIPKIPPYYKKPCPPLPKVPLHPKLPPIPKHPKYFPHPKFGKWPPLPPHP
ncbi:hypothetical protein F2P56_036344 [Juglans regia]|uniref:Proline-rich protein 4-like n=2 Tax=Juglans regia TaxID=51240 RepID=A0A833TR38_JUGRE|nr:proline-rich protein 4-like [Juglans regia]KAF5443818.1 hypothetical protein F2P56_036344 [Juglans regia]